MSNKSFQRAFIWYNSYKHKMEIKDKGIFVTKILCFFFTYVTYYYTLGKSIALEKQTKEFGDRIFKIAINTCLSIRGNKKIMSSKTSNGQYPMQGNIFSFALDQFGI